MNVNADRGGVAIGHLVYQRPETAGKPVRLTPRPAFLAGREELLAELEARLSSGDGEWPRVVVLCGLGGTGKTSVALEYAYRHLAALGMAWQFKADEPTASKNGFGDLAALIGAQVLLDVGTASSRHTPCWPRGREVAAHLRQRARPGRAAGVLPPEGHGRVLITSQNPTGQASDGGAGARPDAAAAFLLAGPVQPTSARQENSRTSWAGCRWHWNRPAPT